MVLIAADLHYNRYTDIIEKVIYSSMETSCPISAARYHEIADRFQQYDKAIKGRIKGNIAALKDEYLTEYELQELRTCLRFSDGTRLKDLEDWLKEATPLAITSRVLGNLGD